MSFTITTIDDEFTYTATSDKEVIDQWVIKNNNKTSTTQGYLIKIEKGETRVESLVSLTDTKLNLETNLIPMLTYPANVTVTFNRNILGKQTKTGTFAFADLKIQNEFDNGAEEMEVQIKLIEVIS